MNVVPSVSLEETADVAAVRRGDPLADEQTQPEAPRSIAPPLAAGQRIEDLGISAGGIAPMLCTCTRTTVGARRRR